MEFSQLGLNLVNHYLQDKIALQTCDADGESAVDALCS